MSYQKWLIVILLVGGAILLSGEYLLVRWYPGHKQRVTDAALKQLPYQSDGFGLQMQVAACLYGKVADGPGNIKIYRSKLLGGGPSIVITQQPNATGSSQFSPQYMADLETAGVRNELFGYQFQHLTLANNRDAILLWQYNARQTSMNVTERVMAPDRIMQAVCNTGSGNTSLYARACDESLRSIKLAGPPSSSPPTMSDVGPKTD